MIIVGVVVEVAEGGEEGAFLSFGLPAVRLLDRLLVETALGLVLARGVVALILALARVVLVDEGLLLGAVRDEVVRISTSIASLLRATTASAVQTVVVKPREPTDDECQLIIPKRLQLLLCD